MGDDLSVRSVRAMCGRICGKNLQTSDVLEVLRARRSPVTLQEQASNTSVTEFVLKSTPSSNASVKTQEPLTGGRADLNGFIKDSCEYVVTPQSPSVATLPTGTPPAPKKEKTERVSYGSEDGAHDFGEHSKAVLELLTVEANLAQRQGSLTVTQNAEFRRKLARWHKSKKLIVGAFAHGLEIAIERGIGVDFAGGVMRRATADEILRRSQPRASPRTSYGQPEAPRTQRIDPKTKML